MALTKLPVITAAIIETCAKPCNTTPTYCFLHFLQIIKQTTISELQSRWRPSLILYVSQPSLLVKVIFSSNPSSIPFNLTFLINLDQLNSSLVFRYSEMIRLSDTSSAYVLLNFKVIQLIASSIDFSFTPNTFPEWYLSVFLIYHIKGAASNLRQFFGNINPFKVLCLLEFLKNAKYIH